MKRQAIILAIALLAASCSQEKWVRCYRTVPTPSCSYYNLIFYRSGWYELTAFEGGWENEVHTLLLCGPYNAHSNYATLYDSIRGIVCQVAANRKGLLRFIDGLPNVAPYVFYQEEGFTFGSTFIEPGLPSDIYDTYKPDCSCRKPEREIDCTFPVLSNNEQVEGRDTMERSDSVQDNAFGGVE